MLSQKQSRCKFAWQSFWKSQCGKFIILSLAIGLIIGLICLLLYVWIYFNKEYLQVRNVFGAMCAQFAIVFSGAGFILIVIDYVFELIALCKKNPNNSYWQLFLKSKLFTFLIWILIICLALLSLFLLYKFNIWIIVNHYYDFQNNKNTLEKNASALTALELFFSIYILPFIILALMGICSAIIWFFELCKTTKKEMEKDLEAYDELQISKDKN